MHQKQMQQTVARRAAMIVSAILLSATAACSTLEASLERGGDSASSQNGGDVLDQLARDSQSGG
jgi:hypothetical protein